MLVVERGVRVDLREDSLKVGDLGRVGLRAGVGQRVVHEPVVANLPGAGVVGRGQEEPKFRSLISFIS